MSSISLLKNNFNNNLFKVQFSCNLLNKKFYATKPTLKEKPLPIVHQLSFVIDGPAASGKSSIARSVSKKLGLNWVDSQSLYRALALKCKEHNININKSNSKEISSLAEESEFDFKYNRDKENFTVLLDNADVTKKIQDLNIPDKTVLTLLSIPEVTNAMKSKQRKLVYISNDKIRKELESKENEGNSDEAKIYCTILEGRSAGKDVFPDAHIILNLKANVNVRAERRFKEAGNKKSLEDIITEMKENEANFSSLTKPIKRALNINTTELLPNEQEETVEFLIKDRIKRYFENVEPY